MPFKTMSANALDRFIIAIQKLPSVKRVIYSDPATIVLWGDGTKTVVKCMGGEPFEKYAGFCAAVTKKMFGSTTRAKKIAGAYVKAGKQADDVADQEFGIEIPDDLKVFLE